PGRRLRPSDRSHRPALESRGFWLQLEIDCFDLDQSGMNFPVANALEFGELLLSRFDRPFCAGRRPNDDGPLTAAEKLIVSWNLIHETDAIAGHLSRSQSS